MQRCPYSRLSPKANEWREKRIARFAKMRTRKAELHAKRTKNEPIRQEWRGRFAFTLTYQNRMTGDFHALDFYISDKRINSFRVTRDGRPWRKQVSLTDALDGLRKAIPQFKILHE